MANDTEKPATFDSLPAWMTWVDIVQEYGDPNCRCGLCVALRAWIQESAGRTEMHLNELEVLATRLKAHRSETSPGEWKKLNHDLLRSALAAGVKMRKLLSLRVWAGKMHRKVRSNCSQLRIGRGNFYRGKRDVH